jgi:CheY-like chemotaxis protein
MIWSSAPEGEPTRVNGKCAPTGAKSKIVLGVDRPDELAWLDGVIAGEGYTFIAAGSGVQCLGIAARVIPRLILLEIELEGLSGFETCRRLRDDKSLNHIPIAFLTRTNGIAAVRQSVEAGANDFILKSPDPRPLIARVQHWTCTFVGPRRQVRA